LRILVTSGAGFIGSHVADFYAKKGEDVIVYDNLSRGEILGEERASINNMYNWNYLKQNYPKVRLIKGDIRDFESLKAACKDVDVMVHAAAQVAVTTSVDDPRTDFEINALGTFNVLEAARLNDATVIFCSTNKVYGGNVNKIPLI